MGLCYFISEGGNYSFVSWWNRWSFHFCENEINNSEASCFKKSPVYVSVSAKDVAEVSCRWWLGLPAPRPRCFHYWVCAHFLGWRIPGICAWAQHRRHVFLLRRSCLLPPKGSVPVATSPRRLRAAWSSSRHQWSVAQEQSGTSVVTEKNLLFRFGFGNQFGLFVSVSLKYFRDHNHHKIRAWDLCSYGCSLRLISLFMFHDFAYHFQMG